MGQKSFLIPETINRFSGCKNPPVSKKNKNQLTFERDIPLFTLGEKDFWTLARSLKTVFLKTQKLFSYNLKSIRFMNIWGTIDQILEDIDREKIFLRPFEFGGTPIFSTIFSKNPGVGGRRKIFQLLKPSPFDSPVVKTPST